MEIDALANDIDPDGDPLSVVSVGESSAGTAATTTLGHVLFAPALGYVGSTTFACTASDGKGGEATGSIVIDVCADSDSDAICDAVDLCPNHDDADDDDQDAAPDGCDLCPGFNDAADADLDGVPDGCDLCPGCDDDDDADLTGNGDGERPATRAAQFQPDRAELLWRTTVDERHR